MRDSFFARQAPGGLFRVTVAGDPEQLLDRWI
jgi:hypothetical protein